MALLGACGDSDKSSDWKTRPVIDTSCHIYATWNKAIDEWNELTKARDATYGKDTFVDGIIVNGINYKTYEEWAKANGKPVEMVEDNCGQK